MELIDLRPLLFLCSFNVSTIVLQGNVDEEESFILRDRLLPLIICLLRTVSSIIVLHSNYLFVVSWAWVRLQMSPCLTCLFIWGISLLPFFFLKNYTGIQNSCSLIYGRPSIFWTYFSLKAVHKNIFLEEYPVYGEKIVWALYKLHHKRSRDQVLTAHSSQKPSCCFRKKNWICRNIYRN